MPSGSHKWGEVQLKYEKLKSDNERYLTEHDKLTGKIDAAIQKTAQDKTIEMIKNTNYYGREETAEG